MTKHQQEKAGEGRESLAGDQGVTCLRVYLGVDSDHNIEATAEQIADLLLKLGFNRGGEDDLVTAVIAAVPDTPDVHAWGGGAEEFFAAIKDDAAFIVVPDRSQLTDSGEAGGERVVVELSIKEAEIAIQGCVNQCTFPGEDATSMVAERAFRKLRAAAYLAISKGDQ